MGLNRVSLSHSFYPDIYIPFTLSRSAKQVFFFSGGCECLSMTDSTLDFLADS